MKTKQPNYNIYPSLLDAYQQYVDSDIIWEKYWGFCDTPPHTPEEFHDMQFQSVIDRINRVPYDNEAVAIYYKDKKLGYVPKEKNSFLSTLLYYGYGDILEARIQYVNVENHPERQFRVVVKIKDNRK